MRSTPAGSVFLVSLLLYNLIPAPVRAQEPQAQLRIVIVEGEGAINNVRQRVNREPIVQVEDENRRPVAGAAVVFLLPGQGPGGVFANGTRTLTTITDVQGRAVASGIRPNNQNGQMVIRVTASFAGASASAVITQTNVGGSATASSSSSASTGLSTSAKILIIVGIAGGAAAGGIFAATRGGSSSPSTGPTPTVITPGTVTVGGPR